MWCIPTDENAAFVAPIEDVLELSVFTAQCLNRNIDSMKRLQEEATAWYVDRNSRQKGIDWQFTIGDARTKLKRLYPVIELEN